MTCDLFSILTLIAGSILVGIWLGRYTSRLEKPDIHVHLPDKANLPDILTGVPLENNPRALLYWQIYKTACDRGADYPEDEARDAVESVYGRLP